MMVRHDLKWNDRVNDITAKAAKRLYLLSQLRRTGIKAADLVAFYCSDIRSVLQYVLVSAFP